MATVSAKKGKKVKKNNKLSLGEFLTDGNTAVLNQVQISVPVKVGDWGDDGDDDDDDRGVRTQVIALPTAPRATRILDDDSISQYPPFSIYVSNLPYDINEEDLYEIFADQEIVAMSLPRDDGDSRRLRGFGNIEFATRVDLIEVLAMPEPMVRNRRIRIGPYNENDTKRRNNRYDNFTSSSDADRSSSGNWRDGPRGLAKGGDDRDRDGGGMRRSYNTGYNRDREERPAGDPAGGGNWRTGDRPPPAPPLSPSAHRRTFDRERDNVNGFRRMPDIRSPRTSREQDAPMERPKLKLQPRTLPLPEQPKQRADSDDESREDSEVCSGNGTGESAPSPPRPRPTPVPAAKVFGDAKPVDTAAREREIEERLRERERLVREERQRKKEADAAASAAASAEVAEGTASSDDQKRADTGDQDAEKENNDAEPNSTTNKPEEVSNWRVRKTNSSEEDNGKGNKAPHAPADKRPPQAGAAAKYNSPSGGKFLSNRRVDDRKPDNRDSNRGMMHRSAQSNGELADRDHQRDPERQDRAGRDRDGEDSKAGHTKLPLEKERECDPKVLEDRMPKFQEPSGPNLSMKNTFEGLSEDGNDD